MFGQVLGSSGRDGIPAPFCRCPVCLDAVLSPLSNNFRSRPSFLFSSQHSHFMFEISPDLRLQSSRFHLHVFDSFFVSHHWDLLDGLWNLHAWSEYDKPGNIFIYASAQTIQRISDSFGHIPKHLIVLNPFEPVFIDDLSITPLPVYHSFSRDNYLAEPDLHGTFAFLFQDDSSKVAYLADYYKFPSRTV